MTPNGHRIDPELVRLLDQRGPRYTSYPTALEFHGGVGAADYAEHLARAEEREPGLPIGLYLHIPFGERHCTFCACHVIATPHREVAAAYLEALGAEIELLARRLPTRRSVAQMSWGGGTPTYFSPAELERLFESLTAHFSIAPGAELAIEIDPRVTTGEHLEVLARLGFNRLSLGVQDFSPEVQQAIGRDQTFEQTRSTLEAARALGFREGINVDFVYGLPRQNEANFRRSLDRLVALRPDRVAMYSFAHVPWSRPVQRRLDTASLPSRDEKLALYVAAIDRLLESGYEPIGMDHFALPGDDLAEAARAGRLERNFMGYTVKASAVTVALGTSAISELEGAYFQNDRTLAGYHDAIAAGRLPIQRGYVLDDDDRLRQYVIHRLMCSFAVDRDDVELRFAVEFDRYFEAALTSLERARSLHLVADEGRALRVTNGGRLFVRNVCMAFDRHLEARVRTGRPAYSRTV